MNRPEYVDRASVVSVNILCSNSNVVAIPYSSLVSLKTTVILVSEFNGIESTCGRI